MSYEQLVALEWGRPAARKAKADAVHAGVARALGELFAQGR